jgi:hypothetical protein
MFMGFVACFSVVLELDWCVVSYVPAGVRYIMVTYWLVVRTHRIYHACH